ncbi:hypothetical protein BKH43_02595 [Helicobacter sp. 13S00401-1]|uniref:hypothetical protein n=1 Tax=Helicobacter sp. 13S00401-1 TaxID=1905758 RepID=UPI000BA56C2C|nr:hypothetical protein [Helicobacter sp. 13S00401-1]PAF51113.1 hypothetical protein BKH43_02595 [Helicobacter sp. 13S00401-1]
MEEDSIKVSSWIDNMKVALLEKDSKKAFLLTQDLPAFKEGTNIEDLNIVLDLIKEAINLLEDERALTKSNLDKIKQAKKFFK